MADRLWAALASKHGVLQNRPETWTKLGYAQFGDLARSGAFAGMMSVGLAGLLDDFFGDESWRNHRSEPPAPLMVTFPLGRRPWNVPSQSWHLDLGRAEDALRQAGTPWPAYVRIFTFLLPVEAGGGGTAYLAGSHQAAIAIMGEMAQEGRDIRSAAVVKQMKAESDWIAGLYAPGGEAERIARFMENEGELRGIRLRVREMTGEPGDVVFWHPALLHTMAPNCGRAPLHVIDHSPRELAHLCALAKSLRHVFHGAGCGCH